MSDLPITGDWPPHAAAIPVDRPMIPGYEIIAELGRGGMGVVYKARQLSPDRIVAIKLLRDSALAGSQELGRFRIEAESVARVQHPNVIQIYEAGEHQGHLYIAMELAEGGSLDHEIAGQPQPVRPAATLVRTLALAIEHAHTHQVIHRDLKPGNILLADVHSSDSQISPSGTEQSDQTPDRDDSGIGQPTRVIRVPKITDFGLAKRLDRDSTAWTQTGAVLGTASYMAPEQASGRVREIGPAVDVYGLGAILYELLTGRPPFQAETRNETIEQVLHDEPAPPTRLHSDVPSDLETICLKCLEKDPARRYSSAAELADDLGRFLEGRPVVATPLSARERLTRLAARDGYQIVNEIGSGHQSTVYFALFGPIKQPVAIKVFTSGICTREQWEARLRRGTEVGGSVQSNQSLAAAVAHPHVVAVQQAGWWDGAPFVASEYLAHGSLAAKLNEQQFTIRQALRMVEQLAETVMYLHRQGVIHANLKPTNVLLAADEIPRIVDFRWIAGPFANYSVRDGETAPAPPGLEYLAPELVAKPHSEPRPHTDVYGLGIILYELLAGGPPFQAAGLQETLAQIREQIPVPPSRSNSKVTPQLDAFCMRCLRKDPWRRFHRAYDVLTRVRQFQSDATNLR